MVLTQTPRESFGQQQFSHEASRLAKLPGTYRSTLKMVRVGMVELSGFETAAFTARRSPGQVMTTPVDVVRVVIVVDGLLHVRQDGRRSSVAGNHVTVLRTSAAYQYAISEQSEVVVIAVPVSRLTLASRRNLRSVTAAEISRPMLVETIVALMRPLFAQTTRSALQSEPIYESVMISFVNSVITGDTELAAGAGRPGGSAADDVVRGGSAQLVARATIVILDRIRSSDLVASMIASELGVSTRNLYRAFELEKMSVGELVRTTRLDMVAARLRANHADWSYERLARDHGFRSTDVCARAFKARFGVTMSVYQTTRRPVTVGR